MPDSKNENPHISHRQRVYARYLKEGLDGFQPHEVLELLLFFAIPRRDVNPLAHRLIDHFGSLNAVLDAHPVELMKVEGISERAAILMSMMRPIMGRYQLGMHEDRVKLTTWGKVQRYARDLVATHREEVCYLILMDSKGALLATKCMARGTVSEVDVPIRQVVEETLRHRAAQVMLVHNHPGGEALPSHGDVEYTQLLSQALSAMEIPLVDHIIVADDDVYSFKLTEN